MRRLILMSLFVFCPLAEAERLTVAFGIDKPPYVMGQTRIGLEVDIFREALAVKGHDLLVVHLNNMKLREALDNISQLDAVTTQKPQPDSPWHFVEDFTYYHNFAMSRQADDIDIEEIADLSRYQVVAFEGASEFLGGEFQRLFGKGGSSTRFYQETASQRRQMAMFWTGKAEVVVADKTVFDWYRQSMELQLGTGEPVRYHDIFPDKTWYGVYFRDAIMAEDFAEGLAEIKANGLYDLLYKNYTE
ncbi:transporter substrate-binding domain-containing protein [Lacimicrobium sp. SS2-24]|uniref:transporter substrate-binding domain-containing protein n=1 Tax=Lacimicrobium sp. SS2-24 TaxID=2005569 RepID=UPI00143A7DC3|nr:transporter substrate-binding domain-containing protein [Lacimicrobium sp. SS2-24]